MIAFAKTREKDTISLRLNRIAQLGGCGYTSRPESHPSLDKTMSTPIHPLTDILEKAKYFAISAHESIQQRRKYTNEPYQVHCERVVNILSDVTKDKEVLAAAWMHDVLEDVAPLNPYYSEETLRQLFGDRVCNLVIELTDTKLSEGNRATRKARDRMRLNQASNEAKIIKLADLIDNLIDIQKHDRHFLTVFAREASLLLPCLATACPPLYSRLSELLSSVLRRGNGLR